MPMPSRSATASTFAKAAASNLLARFVPSLYVRLTRQTGRGADERDPDDIASYFFRCVDDYAAQLQLDATQFAAFLQGRRVLEYGPGDILGVALLLYARGAAAVHCVDRFPLERMSAKNVRVCERLLERLDGAVRQRAEAAFQRRGQPESGFRPECVRYTVTPDGLAGQTAVYDLVISRAVLEHVNSLERTLADAAQALAPGGIAIHNVDLKSHNLDRCEPFDFLTWPEWAYRLMYSHKGFPNRWRVDAYRRIVAAGPLQLQALAPTGQLPAEAIERIQPRLAACFRGVSADDLRWLGFWMVLRHPALEEAATC